VEAEAAVVIHGRPAGAAGGRRWPRDAAIRGVLAILTGIAPAGLAACGGATGGAGRPAAGGGHSVAPAAAVKASAGVPVCAAAGRLDRAVLRTRASRARAILPRVVTIGGASRVRAMAAALCALPPLPAAAHCPAAPGGAVRLMFAAGRRAFPPVRIQDSGCPHVTGVGPARPGRGLRFPGGC